MRDRIGMKALTTLRRRAQRCLLAAGLLLATMGAQAGTCTYAANNSYGSAATTYVSPLNISSLTVGRDIPDGTAIYGTVITPRVFRATCTGASANIFRRWTLSRTPLPLSTWNGTPWPGRVYQTGVAGIGVALWVGNTGGGALPDSVSIGSCPSTGCSPVLDSSGAITNGVFLSLIKIGPVSAGVINAANLPSAALDLVTDNALALMRLSFSGSINIVSQTCSTPNVNVDLGKHKTSVFTGRGSATPWKDFNIVLNNCPAFYGRRASVAFDDSSTGWAETNHVVFGNLIGFTITPTTATDRLFSGTVQLNATSTATGVGVQIAEPVNNFPLPFNLRISSDLALTTVSGASYSIPLRARYIQTGAAAPTPGTANTSMMFTMDYQ